MFLILFSHNVEEITRFIKDQQHTVTVSVTPLSTHHCVYKVSDETSKANTQLSSWASSFYINNTFKLIIFNCEYDHFLLTVFVKYIASSYDQKQQ